MNRLLLVLSVAALWLPATAAAKGTCLERCSESLIRCTGRCNFDAKCMGRCQAQLDTCNDACGKAGDTQVPMPKRCTDAKGRSVSCEAFSTPSQKSPKPPTK